jgi:indolepyruvate ferredoxin oxidoreductase alpha subunit
MMNSARERVSGAQLLAQGVLDAGVGLITGYPGSPITQVVDEVVQSSTSNTVRVEWTSNEKTAIEIAYGASLGGLRSLLCVKSVGLNIALDPLMALNLAGCEAGFVILVGDDPGGWGSQNEQDSRSLAKVAQIPLLEPTTTGEALSMMVSAFQLSEESGLPIVLRVIRALTSSVATPVPSRDTIRPTVRSPLQGEFERRVVLPENVVPRHEALLDNMEKISTQFNSSIFNAIEGQGEYGVITSGFAYQKVIDLLEGSLPSELCVLRVGTLNPLPYPLIERFLRGVSSAIVIEESVPLLEREVRAVAQRSGMHLPIFGRDTAHVPLVGELFSSQLSASFQQFLPDHSWPGGEVVEERAMPSKEPLCEGCSYIPVFDALVEVMERGGGRERFIVVGDPGCMVRAQTKPYDLLDVKTSLGSSISIAAGIALSHRDGESEKDAWSGNRKKVIALSGDSGFFHSGYSGLIDAVRLGVELLVIILENGSAALSGGQPHAGTAIDLIGAPRRPVKVKGLAEQSGAHTVCVIDTDGGQDLLHAFEDGLLSEGVSVVIAQGTCVLWNA